MRIYKREEGLWARMPVAIIGGIITVFAARATRKWADGAASYILAGAVFALLGAVTLFFAFFHRKTGEVLIETEGELRKVVWPTREEVVGSTTVVITTVFIFGGVLYAVDVGLASVLHLIGLY